MPFFSFDWCFVGFCLDIVAVLKLVSAACLRLCESGNFGCDGSGNAAVVLVFVAVVRGGGGDGGEGDGRGFVMVDLWS